MATQNNTSKIMLAKNMRPSEKYKDNLIKGAICLDILSDEIVKELSYEHEGKRYLNVKVVKRKETTQYGATHYIEVDPFKAQKQKPKERE